MKLLTVVICCYNSSNTIKDTLNSIDIEHNKDVDVFIIDDGSKDNLEDTVKEYITKFPDNFHYFKKENGNWGSCINFAIVNANSKYLSILDSDDTYDVPAFNYVMKELRALDQNTDLVLCNYVWKFLNKTKHNLKEINFSKTTRQHEYISLDCLNLFHVITIHSAIFNLNLLKQIKPLPEKTYYSDGVLIYQSLLLTKKICYMNKSIHWYNYCIRTGSEQSISAEKTVKNYHNLEIVFDAFVSAPFPLHPSKKQIQIARKFICNHFYWFYFALSKNYNYTHKEKVLLLKQYYQKLINFENKYGIKLRTKLAKFFNFFKGPLLPIINFVTQYLPISFLKASRYTREQKKKAKAEAKAKRQQAI